jgi:hypothetical protein
MVTENEKLICLEYGEFFDGGDENNERIRKLLGKRIYLHEAEVKLNDKMDGSARYQQRFIEKTDALREKMINNRNEALKRAKYSTKDTYEAYHYRE